MNQGFSIGIGDVTSGEHLIWAKEQLVDKGWVWQLGGEWVGQVVDKGWVWQLVGEWVGQLVDKGLVGQLVDKGGVG